MPKMVLITGASGLVGTKLTEVLLEKGYNVSHLGRQRTSKKYVKPYIWDIPKGFIEDGALENANIVVHLAGAGVAEKRWTKFRKQEILQSRVQTTRLLFNNLAGRHSPCELVVAASAVGIYGLDTGSKWQSEDTPPGDGFLAGVTKVWEQEIRKLEELKLRVVTLRTGIVLSNLGGALPKMVLPVRYNMGAALGSGKQYMSWIHIADLCAMFTKAIEDSSLNGVYNAVAPCPVTNSEFTRCLADAMGKKLWLPRVPGLGLRILLGEMAQLVLGGNRVSADKICSWGFKYQFDKLQPALESLLGKYQVSKV